MSFNEIISEKLESIIERLSMNDFIESNDSRSYSNQESIIEWII